MENKNFIHKRRLVSTSREPPWLELESQCERSDLVSLRYLQGVNLVELRVDFYMCDVVNLLMLYAFQILLWKAFLLIYLIM